MKDGLILICSKGEMLIYHRRLWRTFTSIFFTKCYSDNKIFGRFVFELSIAKLKLGYYNKKGLYNSTNKGEGCCH